MGGVGGVGGEDTAAVLVPVVVGAKVTSTVQVAVGASAVAEQVSVVRVNWLGLSPVNVTAAGGRVRSAVPVLVTVNVWVPDVVPTCWLPNALEVGSTENPGVVPVPDKVMVSGLDNALEVNTSPAVLAPVVVGAKVTSTVQVVVGVTVWPLQVSAAMVNWSGSARTVPLHCRGTPGPRCRSWSR